MCPPISDLNDKLSSITLWTISYDTWMGSWMKASQTKSVNNNILQDFETLKRSIRINLTKIVTNGLLVVKIGSN